MVNGKAHFLKINYMVLQQKITHLLTNLRMERNMEKDVQVMDSWVFSTREELWKLLIVKNITT